MADQLDRHHLPFSLLIPDDSTTAAVFNTVSGLPVKTIDQANTNSNDNKKYRDLVLRDGYVLAGSKVVDWVEAIGHQIADSKIQIENLILIEHAQSQKIIRQVNIIQAFPIDWQLSPNKRPKGEVPFTSITFAYRFAHETPFR